jgi:hypothetical protein
MRTIILSLCFTGILEGVAVAQTDAIFGAPAAGYTYFNRPGATLQQHREDIEACYAPVAAMPPATGPQVYDPVAANPSYYSQTYGAAGAVAGSIAVAAMQAQMARNVRDRAVAGHYENCMLVKGWRLVRVTANVGRRLEHLSRVRLLTELEPMIAAEQPDGEILRTFSNELVHPQGAPPRTAGGRAVSLSLLAAPAERLFTDRRREDLARGADQQRPAPAAASASLSPVEDLTALPSDAALLIVTMANGGRTMTFVREGGPETVWLGPQKKGLSEGEIEEPAAEGVAGAEAVEGVAATEAAEGAAVAEAADELAVADNATEDIDGVTEGATESTYVFAVPPGRWRIGHIQGNTGSISLCLGAPAFEVGPSEVVFAGSYSGEAFAPDMSTTPAETALAIAPDFASRLRTASYVNGAVSSCEGAFVFYAYEIPGAPFAQDYRWGSRAFSEDAPISASQ